jgi:hypothetical protein
MTRRPDLSTMTGGSVVAGAMSYLVVLVLVFPRTVHAVLWNSDAASPLVFARTVGREHLGAVVLGKISYASTLGFDLVVRPLPWHEQLWLIAPYAVSLLGAVLIAWSAWQAGGIWPAAMAFALGVAVAPDVLYTQVAPAFHGTTWFGVALLGAFLVWLSGTRVSARRVALAVGGVGLITGVNLASDPLLLVAGLLPFTLAPWLPRVGAGAVSGPRVRVSCLAMSAVAMLVAAIGWVGMLAAGFSTARLGAHGPFPGISGPAAIVERLRLLRDDLVALVAGGSAGTALRAGLGLLLVVGLVAVVVEAFHDRYGRTAGAAVYAAFWALAALAVQISFLLTDLPTGPSTTSDRYLVPVVFAAAAVAPLAARHRPHRLLAALAVMLFCATSTYSLATADLARRKESLPLAEHGPVLIRSLEQHGLRRGYGNYWDAAALTWRSDLRLRIAPIDRCGNASRQLCPYLLNSASAWYRPRRNINTFLVLDPSFDNIRSITAIADRVLGTPIETLRAGSLSALVYSYDIAGRLGARTGAGIQVVTHNDAASATTGLLRDRPSSRRFA